MANFNKVILVGNLTRNPELKYTNNQTPVVNFGLAVNRKWKDQQGNKKEDTCFVDCSAFDKIAETINTYCQKGNPLLVEGRLNFSKWQDTQTGQNRTKLDVIVESMQLMGGNPNNNQNTQAPAQGGYNQPPQNQQGYNNPPAQGGYNNAPPQQNGYGQAPVPF